MRWMLVFYFNTKSLFFIGSLASPPLIKEEKSNCFFFFIKKGYSKNKNAKKEEKENKTVKAKERKWSVYERGGGYILGNYLVLRLTDFLLQSSSSIVSLIGLLIGEEGVARRGQ